MIRGINGRVRKLIRGRVNDTLKDGLVGNLCACGSGVFHNINTIRSGVIESTVTQVSYSLAEVRERVARIGQ